MKLLSAVLIAIVGAGLSLPAQTLSQYQSTVNSHGPATYFTFDGTLEDSISNVVLNVAGATGVFAPDAFGNQGTARAFVGTSDGLSSGADVIPGGGAPDPEAAGTGSIVLLFAALDLAPSGQRFILSQGNSSGNGNACSLFVENQSNPDPGSLKLRIGNGTHVILPGDEFVRAAWYYLAITYDESRDDDEVNWYLGRLGGELNSGVINMGNDAVVGDDGTVHIGNNGGSAAFRDGTAPASVGRIDELAIWDRELTEAEVQEQFSKLPHPNPNPRATYQTVVSGQSPNYYFKLDNDLTDSVGGSVTLDATGGDFVRDYFGNADGSRSFAAAADRLQVNANLVNGGGSYTGEPGTGKGTISFLFRHLNFTNNSGQRFLFSAGGATSVTNGFGLFVENYTSASGLGALKLRLGNSSQVIQEPSDYVYSAWYYFAMTYDESLSGNQVTWYLGRPGETLESGVLSYVEGVLAGQGNVFVIGSHTNTSSWSRPGFGYIDEFAIWHDTLSPAQIQAQFEAIEEVPVTITPELTIALSGADVVISWPTNGAAGFELESTTALASPSTWTPAGPATIVGDEYVVTEPATGTKFYRLRK